MVNLSNHASFDRLRMTALWVFVLCTRSLSSRRRGCLCGKNTFKNPAWAGMTIIAVRNR